MTNTKAESFGKLSFLFVLLGLVLAGFTGQFKATLAVLANFAVILGLASMVWALIAKYKN